MVALGIDYYIGHPMPLKFLNKFRNLNERFSILLKASVDSLSSGNFSKGRN